MIAHNLTPYSKIYENRVIYPEDYTENVECVRFEAFDVGLDHVV